MQRPHPLVRLMLLIGLALTLPMQSSRALALLLAALAILGLAHWRGLLAAVYRLRWLFVSIGLVYLAFGAVGADGPTFAERLGALGRPIGILALLAMAAELLFATTPVEHVAASLVELLWPLQRLGLPVERFAVRFALTLQVARTLAPELRERMRAAAREPRAGVGDSMAAAVAALVQQAERDAEESRPAARLPPLGRLRRLDFLWLAAGAVVLGVALQL